MFQPSLLLTPPSPYTPNAPVHHNHRFSNIMHWVTLPCFFIHIRGVVLARMWLLLGLKSGSEQGQFYSLTPPTLPLSGSLLMTIEQAWRGLGGITGEATGRDGARPWGWNLGDTSTPSHTLSGMQPDNTLANCLEPWQGHVPQSESKVARESSYTEDVQG